MNCVLLHGLGQSPADWKDTINNIDKSTAVFVRACSTGCMGQYIVTGICTKVLRIIAASLRSLSFWEDFPWAVFLLCSMQ